jgi:7-carboxy-7-deazaguanine synthase
LEAKDQLKFVIASREDFVWSRDLLEKHNTEAEVLFSPAYESLNPTELAEWVLEKQLNVRLQLQLHKILWGEAKGR